MSCEKWRTFEQPGREEHRDLILPHGEVVAPVVLVRGRRPPVPERVRTVVMFANVLYYKKIHKHVGEIVLNL